MWVVDAIYQSGILILWKGQFRNVRQYNVISEGFKLLGELKDCTGISLVCPNYYGIILEGICKAE